jgi:glycosyltransferase involved in cell wall biosynthesis
VTSLLWHSNAGIGPVRTETGYGLQSWLFVPRIRDLGYKITFNAPMSLVTAPFEVDGVMLMGSSGDPLGNDSLPQRAAQHDLTITLCDLFGLFPCAPALAGRKIAHWMPVDCQPMGERDIATLRATGGVPIAMSRFGFEQIRREGFDPLYVPHGVDTSIFCPGDRAEFRAALGISPDTFVIGLVAVNKPDSRKGLDQQMQAFAAFHDRHPDSLLFMHVPKKGGWDLEKIALNLGILPWCAWPEQHQITSQFITWQDMARWYRSLDVLSACSEAEGFGVPVLEAQACGTPVVTGNYSSTAELCGSGWLVEGQRHWTGGHEAWWVTPDVLAIYSGYEAAYATRGDPSIREAAAAFARDYDVDTVAAEYWKPVLAEIEARHADR